MEGYVIKNSSSFAMITSPIGGNYVSQSAMQMLKSEHHPKFHLSYEIASKEELKPGQTGSHWSVCINFRISGIQNVKIFQF